MDCYKAQAVKEHTYGKQERICGRGLHTQKYMYTKGNQGTRRHEENSVTSNRDFCILCNLKKENTTITKANRRKISSILRIFLLRMVIFAVV